MNFTHDWSRYQSRVQSHDTSDIIETVTSVGPDVLTIMSNMVASIIDDSFAVMQNWLLASCLNAAR